MQRYNTKKQQLEETREKYSQLVDEYNELVREYNERVASYEVKRKLEEKRNWRTKEKVRRANSGTSNNNWNKTLT